VKLYIPGFGESRRRERRKTRMEGRVDEEARSHEAKQRRTIEKNLRHHIHIPKFFAFIPMLYTLSSLTLSSFSKPYKHILE